MGLLLEQIMKNSIALSATIMIVFLARFFLRKSPRIFSYMLWFFVLIRILCPVTVKGIYAVLPEDVESSVSSTVEQMNKRQNEWMKQRVLTAGTGEVLTENATVDGRSEKTAEAAPETENVQELSMQEGAREAVGDRETAGVASLADVWTEISRYDVLGLIWTAGFAILAIYLFVNLVLAHLRLKDAVPMGNNIYKSDAVANSLVCGLIHPHIYVNPELAGRKLDCILAHENCHIRRLDYIVKPVAFLIFSTNWFNPLVWVAYRLMMKDMEMSCDERVMKKLGNSVKKEYSYLLLNMAQKPERKFMQTPAFGGKIVKQRIRNVLSYKRPAVLTLIVSALVIGVCGCSVFSSPEGTPVPTQGIYNKLDKGTYIEQKVLSVTNNIWGSSKEVYHSAERDNLQDMEGNMYLFADEITIQDGVYRAEKTTALKFADGKLTSVKLPWAEDVQKFADKEEMYVGDRFFGQDGKYYQTFTIYNRRPKEKETDESLLELKVEGFRLLQMDMKENKWREIPLPSLKDKKTGIVQTPYVSVLADGNVIVNQYGIGSGIYSPVDGKKIRDIQIQSNMVPRAGNGEYYAISHVGAKKNIPSAIIRYDEKDGEKIHEISLTEAVSGLDADKEVAHFFYYQDTYYFVCSKGIYRAEADDDAFTLMIDPKESRTYWLNKAKFYPISMFVDEENESCYVSYYEDSISSASDEFFCSYKKTQ